MAEPIVHLPEGFQMYGSLTTSYLDSNDVLHLNVNAPVIQIPAEGKRSVVAAMSECVPGTVVFLPGWTKAWQYTVSNTWVQFV